MTPIDRLIGELRRKDVKLSLQDGSLRCNAPPGVLTDELQFQIKEHKSELIAFLRAARGSTEGDFTIRPQTRHGRIPLSFAQEGAWFIDQLQPGVTFNIALSARLSGRLDLQALQSSLDEIVRRHEALRTTFGVFEGRPFQVVNDPKPVPVDVVDLQQDSPEKTEAGLLSLFVKVSKTPFDLAKGPLMRLTVARMSPRDHALLLAIHHSVFDGWSVGVIAGEMSTLYERYLSGNTEPLPPPKLQFADYAIWQRRAIDSELYQSQLDYWRRTLAGFPPELELVPDKTTSNTQLFIGDAISLELGPALGRRMRDQAKAEGVTLFMLLVANFKAMLMRYTDQEDIIIGTPVANRSQEEMAGVIGFCVNMLALRTDLSGNPTYRELLRSERDVCLGAYSNQELPFGLVVQELVPDRNVANSPVFQAQFSLQESPGDILTLPDLEMRPLFDFSEKFEGLNRMLAYALPAFDPLSLWATEAPTSFTITLHYRADLFNAETVRGMLEHLRTIIETGIEDPGRRIMDIDLLSAGQRLELLEEYGSNPAVLEPPRMVHRLMEDIAQARPDVVALEVPATASDEQPQKTLTYAQLNRRANRLAHYLLHLGLRPQQRVGISMEKSPELIVSVWAALKAGLPFVALDHAHGMQRLEYMIQESQVEVLLTQRGLLEPVDSRQLRVVEVDAEWETIAQMPHTNPEVPLFEDQLAYVVYTSGSTGRPKGVMVSHANLSCAYRAWEHAYRLPEIQSHLQMANFAFDVFIGDLVRAHCSGARLILCPREILLQPDRLVRLIRERSVDCAEFVPAVIRALLTYLSEHNERLDGMKLIAVGSDRWSAAEYERLRRAAGAKTRVLNSYGVAEATIDSCFFGDQRFGLNDRMLPVGRPLPGTTLYVLDRRLAPTPVGVPGELYIGGAGVAGGYLDRPAMTAERFVPNPFSDRPGQRLYRTGDRARWRPDAQLELLGRMDQQVKVRGFRIEPGEVEAILQTHPAVDQALVTAKADAASQEQRLVAYVVTSRSDGGPEEDEPSLEVLLRSHLSEQLPDYMVPTAIMTLDAIPLTPNGKIDQRALPDPNASGAGALRLVPVRTPTEHALAVIWRRVLGVESIGANSDFFALGGHSLKASEIVYRIRETLGVDLPLRTIFEAPTVEGLAHAIDTATSPAAALPPITPGERPEMIPLAYAQEGAWFIDQLQPGVPFNIPLPWHLRGPLDLGMLERALAQVIERHESLRTTFASDQGQPYQVIHPASSVAVPMSVVDLRDTEETKLGAQLIEELIARAGTSFDLSRGPLISLTVFRLKDDEQILLFTAHHIIFDGHSVSLLARDLATLYEAERTGVAATLPPAKIQYADYALWQRRLLTGDYLQSELDYWSRQLAGCPPGLNLALEHTGDGEELFRGETATAMFSNSLSSALRDLSQSEGTTLFILMLAAYKLLLARYTGQEDLVVGSPVANRSQPETANMVGFCVNMLAFRTDLSGNPTFRELLQREREVCLAAYSHQELPFGLLVQHLRPNRHLSHSPFFSVGFGLQQAAGNTVQVAQFESSSLIGLDAETIKAEIEKRRADVTPSTDLMFLQIADSGSQIAAVLQVSSALFSPGTGDEMMRHFERLLEAISADPDTRLFDVPLMDAEERRRLLVDFNAHELELRPGLLLHRLVEGHARTHPDAPAALIPPAPATDDEEQHLSYEQLNARANQLARYLRDKGLGPECRVGICLERSADMLICILGALKAGAAYVPLDPANGPERLSYMIDDSRSTVVLTHHGLLAEWDLQAEVIQLEHIAEHLAAQPAGNLDLDLDEESLAYVIYTSGSTGRPKGAMVSHRNLAGAYQAWEAAYDLRSLRRHLQMANFSFDVFTADVTRALGSGGAVVLCPRESLLLPAELCDLMRRYEVDCAEFVPTVVRPLIEHLQTGAEGPESLRTIIVGSDIWRVDEYHRLKQAMGPMTRVVNSYGVAEATVDTSYWESSADEDGAAGLVPIGRPFPNSMVYVLDGYLNPVPPGAAGELYIAGPAVARGYSDRPDLTAARFVPNPLCSPGAPWTRLYRTGDRVRHLADGNLAFLGRVDSQIKVRGFRIEPGEVEAALETHPGIHQALVMAYEEPNGEKSLAGYVTPAADGELNPSELRAFARIGLPDYMVPKVYFVLDKFPLNPNGKVDRRSLPDPSGVRPEKAHEYVAPQTPTEIRLAGLWEEVLGVEEIGAVDNFFALGGHSLQAARLVARVRSQMGVDLPLRSLFEYPTIASLANELEGYPNTASPLPAELVAIQPLGDKPPLLLVHAADGSVAGYMEFARHFDLDQPIYGLQHPGLLNPEEPASLQELAARYLQAAEQITAGGPYLLAGWSAGGLLAYELAQQISREGKDVALLALLDTVVPNTKRAQKAATAATKTAEREFGISVDDFLQMTLDQQCTMVLNWVKDYAGHADDADLVSALARDLGLAMDQMLFLLEQMDPGGDSPRWDALLERVHQVHGTVPAAQRDQLARRLEVFSQIASASVRYEIRGYEAPVTLVKARSTRAGKALGWDKFAGALNVVKVPGNHYSMLSAENAPQVAAVVREAIDEALRA